MDFYEASTLEDRGKAFAEDLEEVGEHVYRRRDHGRQADEATEARGKFSTAFAKRPIPPDVLRPPHGPTPVSTRPSSPPLRALYEQLARVGTVALSAYHQGRGGDLAEPFPKVEGVFGLYRGDHVGRVPATSQRQGRRETEQPPDEPLTEGRFHQDWDTRLQGAPVLAPGGESAIRCWTSRPIGPNR
jgi:hypothetical protein